MNAGDSGVAWTWSVEISRLTRRIQELEDENRTLNEILEQRERVLKSIPPCAAHGQSCVPHALEWIALAKSDIDATRKTREDYWVPSAPLRKTDTDAPYEMRMSREHILRLVYQQTSDLIRMLQEGFSDYSDQLGRMDQKP